MSSNYTNYTNDSLSANNSDNACPAYALFDDPTAISLTVLLPTAFALIFNCLLFLTASYFLRTKNRSISAQIDRPTFPLNCLAISFSLASILRSISVFVYHIDLLLNPRHSTLYSYPNHSAIFFYYYFYFGLADVAHVNFTILLGIDMLIYFVKPLHYRLLLTKKRVLIACATCWIALPLVSCFMVFRLDESITIEIVVLIGLIQVVFVQLLPAVFSAICALVITLIIRRQIRFDGNLRRLSSGGGTSQWRLILRAFRTSLWTNTVYIPLSLMCSILYVDFICNAGKSKLLHDFNCEKTVVYTFLVMTFLYNVYFAGLPVIFVFTRRTYWINLQKLCHSIWNWRSPNRHNNYSNIQWSSSISVIDKSYNIKMT